MKKRIFAFVLAAATAVGVTSCSGTEIKRDKETEEAVSGEKLEGKEEENISENADDSEKNSPEEIEGDRPADYYGDMPYGVYKSDVFAREIHIKESGLFEAYMGHGSESFEPEIGTWEYAQIDRGNEMYADGLILYKDGEEYLTMIWDGDRFFIESDVNQGLVEYMERVEPGGENSANGSGNPFEESPEECILGSWGLRSWENCDVVAYDVYEDGTWEAYGLNMEIVSKGIWTLSGYGDYAYIFFDENGTVYDETSIYLQDGEIVLNSVREMNDYYK